MKNIVIQNFFRSGGTYFYNNFLINNKNLISFYEPFHEVLADRLKLSIMREEFGDLKKKMSHTIKDFYFNGFPIKTDWFNAFHNKSNKYNNDLPNILGFCDEIFFQQKINYLCMLEKYAINQNKTAIFKINRSYLNPTQINSDNNINLLVLRDPIDNFKSYIASCPVYYLKSLHELLVFNKRKNIGILSKIFNDSSFTVPKNINRVLYFKNEKSFFLNLFVFFYIWLEGLIKNTSNTKLIYYNLLNDINYQQRIRSIIKTSSSLVISFKDLYDFKTDEHIVQIKKTFLNHPYFNLFENLYSDKIETIFKKHDLNYKFSKLEVKI